MDDLCNLVATIMAERFAFTMLFDNYLPRAMAYKRFLEETKGVDSPAYSEIYSEIFAEDADEAPGDGVPAAASDEPVKDTAPIATRTRSHSHRSRTES